MAKAQSGFQDQKYIVLDFKQLVNVFIIEKEFSGI
jgi:hypothetical protein